ncbi:MAG: MFS transporter, partial [Bifidobacteriaceae bacterium]|nr:MFS transporter [Bifidobacteriaceae bacterium]
SDAADGEDSGRLFTLPLIAVLCAVFAANFALSGTDLGIVACLRSWGEVSLTGIIMSVWGVTSGLAGFTYGALKRGFHPLLLAVILALVTAPVALARGGLWLGILVGVAGLLCAPTLASANNAITNIVPAGRLGLAMGWYGTVGTAASALGSPLCGTVIDNFGAPAAFLLAAGVSLVLGAGGLIATRHHDLGG